MELYYKAVNKKGESLQGRIIATDKTEAAKYLRNHDLYPVMIEAQKQRQFSNLVPFYHPGTGNLVMFFTRQLSSMLVSGLTLMQSLAVLHQQTTDLYFTEVLQGITSEVQDGHSFAQALSKYPQIFSDIYVAMIRAGEKSGLLDKVLTRLAINLEKSKELKDEIRGALIYPIIIVVLMVVVISVMMLFVVPQLASLYKNLNVQLPFVTQLVIGASNTFIVGSPFIAVGLVGFIIFFRSLYKTPKGKLLVDANMLKIPLIGKLLEKSILVEFTRTFSLLISTGGLVIDSLHQCAATVNNAYYKEAILEVSKRVEKGVTIGDALEASNIFPSILVEMAKIGEQTGKLDETLLRASEYFEREVEQAVKIVTTSIEPIILVVLGISVGFLMIAIITPIYGLVSAIH